jgi:multidrug efflux pump
MNGIVDWAASRARMVLAFIFLSLLAGGYAYVGLPKEGEPDIEIPALFVSVPFPGISAADAEKLLVKPMETQLSTLDGLDTMSGTASEGYAGVSLLFDYGWDKTRVMADVRDAMNTAEAQFPQGADKYSINEINFSEFPVIVVNLTGQVPERTLIRVAKELQDKIESLDSVLNAQLTGQRDEMLLVEIDPLRLEAYNVTAGELINVVSQNNLLIAAGQIDTAQGTFAVKIPSSFDEAQDVYSLPIKTNGNRVVTLGDLATIRLTFEEKTSTARYNGTNTVALQVVKRRGFNLIDTAAQIRDTVAAAEASWPENLKISVDVGTSNDQSRNVASMVSQLEGSVLTAIALVMIVVLASLGARSALLVGFAIPTSFLLTFALLAIMDVAVSNIVMFGLILAVGMLVDGAIVVVEYADKRIQEGTGPMHAYVEAAKRMFWPIVSSTATTLCAFLPMLFWPGVAGQFMGMLPVTLIFVLTASLVVALIYLPVMGGVSGRMTRAFSRVSDRLRRRLPLYARAALIVPAILITYTGAMLTLNPAYLTGSAVQTDGLLASLPGLVIFILGAIGLTIAMGAAKTERPATKINAGYRRSPFGWVIHAIAGNPVMPLVSIGAVGALVAVIFMYYAEHNKGTEFFTATEPEQAIVYVQARGNLSLEEKDALVREAEQATLGVAGIKSVFSFAGAGGLNQNTAGASGPGDTIGQIQLELVPWEDRGAYARENGLDIASLGGNAVMATLQSKLDQIPGIKTQTLSLAMGPGATKPIHLRLKGDDFDLLRQTTADIRSQVEALDGVILVEDTLPLPGIDWQLTVDVAKAGRFGADVASVGSMVQLVTRGVMLDTMRVDSSEEEIEIRVRLPEKDRVLSTLDSLKVRTPSGMVPLSNFVTREPVPQLAQISRVDQTRYFDIQAGAATGLVKLTDVETGATRILPENELEADADLQAAIESGEMTRTIVNANERIEAITEWLDTPGALPAGIGYSWQGDFADQAESIAFLQVAFAGALGLMFIILLAQFNSFYNSVLVLLAVILSTAGVLVGMIVMDQTFSIIMTGTGIVALAGIVVNNNIVLIDTYQEYRQYMPRTEAITRTAEDRIRPVLLTTITTMAGLAPMMFGLSLDFINGGYSIDSPTALWWKQLATAVVFGLGIATFLTLIFTPSMLAVRVWVTTYARWIAQLLAKASMGRSSRAARDWALAREAKRVKAPEIVWTDLIEPAPPTRLSPLKAAE